MSAWSGDAGNGSNIGSGLIGEPNDRSWPDPPDLMQRSAVPAYDAQDLVNLLGVPVNILWGWEQSVGIPRPLLVPDGHGDLLPRYSERDLMAALWLRDQIRAGMSPIEAAHRLLAGQRPLPQLPASAAPASSPDVRGTSGPLGHRNAASGIYPTATPSLRGHSDALGSASRPGPTSGPLRPAPPSGPMLGASQTGIGLSPVRPAGSTSGALGRPSGPLAQSQTYGPPSGPLGQSQTFGPVSGPLRRDLSLAAPSGPLGRGRTVAPASGPLGRGPVTGAFPHDATMPQPPGSSTGRLSGSLHMYQSALLNAFATLDPEETRRLLDEVLADYPVETVCAGLLQPLVTRAAELSAAGRMPPAVEQFGSLMVRNRLGILLDTLRVNPGAPLALLACAPGEFHELGPLMVAIFWRRAGVRAVYLGPDVAEETLLLLAREHWKALFCLSAATDAGARQIARIATSIARTEPPRPMMGYGGSAFVRSPDLQRHVRESYFLGVDAYTATRHVVQLLTEGPLRPR